MCDVEIMKPEIQFTSERSSSSNTGSTECDIISTVPSHSHSYSYSDVEDSWFLEQTIRYQAERARTFGVFRCEVWLSRRSGTELDGDSYRENLPDVVYCWHRNSNTATSTDKNAKNQKSNRLYRSKKVDNSYTLLGERSANRLWSRYKDRPDPRKRVQWRRFGPPSAANDNYYSEGPADTNTNTMENKTAIHWIASIPFAAPAVAESSISDRNRSRSGSRSGSSAISANYRGMVCWLFEATATTTAPRNYTTTTNNNTLNRTNPPLNTEYFLCSATDQIAATYALESFRHLPMPPANRFHPESASNASATNTALGTGRRRSSKLAELAAGLFYNNDDLKSTAEDNKRRKSLESNVLGTGGAGGNDDDDESGHDGEQKYKYLAPIGAYFRKYRGGGRKGPQPLCWKQTFFTFVGSFVAIYLIQCFNVYITTKRSQQNDPDNNIFDATNASRREILNELAFTNASALQMGPFGASCVLIFAMTSAAPSQPRSMMAGVTMGMVIGKLVGYLEAFGVGLGFRMSLATALTASIMARTCTIYPPAGALALIFSSQLLGWDCFILQVTGTALAIALGVVINNIHPHRTYPMFWVGIEGCKSSNHHTMGSGIDGEGDGELELESGCRKTP